MRNDHGVPVATATLVGAIVGSFSLIAAVASFPTGEDARNPLVWGLVVILGLVAVGGLGTAVVAAARTRRRTKEVRRQRGYYAGEMPWSWTMHGVWLVVTPVAAATLLANDSDGGGSSLDWSEWLIVLGTVGTVGSTVWSAAQKKRHERAAARGATPVPPDQPPPGALLVVGACVAAALLLQGIEGLASAEGMLTAWWAVVATAVGAALLVGIVVTALRRLLAQHREARLPSPDPRSHR
ncbi:hypothetical protein ACOACO_08670 [Nocardioides sp. CPCC 205120]|uniref:hypothetical protein n=1 Tax=Nocardioides sp. CPCC 205120 TaxID=3406462 RepID=UPI003B509DBB